MRSSWWPFQSRFSWLVPCSEGVQFYLYSVYSINATRSHIFFSFCEQTLKMAANDASGQGLQSAPKNMHQNNFSRKLWVKNPFSHFLFSCYTPFPTYDPHTILKNAPTRWTIIIFIFIYRTWKWAQMTRLVKGYNMRQRTGTKINFRESYDELTLVFLALKEVKSCKSLFSMKIRILEKQGLLGQKTRVNSS